jgi:hypothetical protein
VKRAAALPSGRRLHPTPESGWLLRHIPRVPPDTQPPMRYHSPRLDAAAHREQWQAGGNRATDRNSHSRPRSPLADDRGSLTAVQRHPDGAPVARLRRRLTLVPGCPIEPSEQSRRQRLSHVPPTAVSRETRRCPPTTAPPSSLARVGLAPPAHPRVPPVPGGQCATAHPRLSPARRQRATAAAARHNEATSTNRTVARDQPRPAHDHGRVSPDSVTVAEPLSTSDSERRLALWCAVAHRTGAAIPVTPEPTSAEDRFT